MEQRRTSHADTLRARLGDALLLRLRADGLSVYDEELAGLDPQSGRRRYVRLDGWNDLHRRLRDAHAMGQREVLEMQIGYAYCEAMVSPEAPMLRDTFQAAVVQRGADRLVLASVPEITDLEGYKAQAHLVSQLDIGPWSCASLLHFPADRDRVLSKRLLILASPLSATVCMGTALRLAL